MFRLKALLVVLVVFGGTGLVKAAVTFDPLADVTSGTLRLWLDADDPSTILDADGTNAGGIGGSIAGFDGSIAQWNDKSGDFRNATALSAPAYISNVDYLSNKPAVRFDGTNAFVFPELLMEQMTVFSVAGNHSGSFFILLGDTDPAPRHLVAPHWNTVSRFVYAPMGPGDVQALHDSVAFVDEDYRTFSIRADGTERGVRWFTNGVEESFTRNNIIGTETFTYSLVSADNLGIFGRQDIAELLVFDGALSVGDQRAVESYLTLKWDVSEAPTVSPRVLVRHEGANDPTTEGWRFRTAPGPKSVGPILGDEGFDAWVLDDNGNGELAYSFELSAAEAAAAVTRGWRLSARLKVANVPDAVDAGILLSFDSGPDAFSVDFGSSSDGSPIVRLGAGEPLILDELDGGYHLYEMQFDPVQSLVTLSVDGVPTLTQDQWGAGPIHRVRFDSGFRGTGEGRWNFVEFEIVPEPSTFVLLTMGAVGLLAYARRRRRR